MSIEIRQFVERVPDCEWDPSAIQCCDHRLTEDGEILAALITEYVRRELRSDEDDGCSDEVTPRELSSEDLDVLERCRYIGGLDFDPRHHTDPEYG